jgi:RNA polymerase sigma-70 factor (ECF subfamily)
MTQAQSGDKKAYHNLLQEITPTLRSYVNRKVGFLNQTEEITQEILISIHRSRQTFIPGRKFGPWMYIIAKRRIVDLIRQEQRRIKAEPLTEASHNIAAEVSGPAIQTDILGELNNLPEKYREPIRLTKVKGLDVKEAAQELGLSPAAIKTRCSRGYAMLRKKIKRS